MQSKTSAKSQHVTPLWIYLGVAGALFALTLITVEVSFIHLGGWNVVVALLIASIKAMLVASIFMHLLFDNKLYLVIFATAVIFLAILIVFTMFDTMERDQSYTVSSYAPANAQVMEQTSPADSLSKTTSHEKNKTENNHK